MEIRIQDSRGYRVVKVNLGKGITATFGEPESKLNSGDFKLLSVEFDKEWTEEEAESWFTDRNLRLYDVTKAGNRKIPEYDFFTRAGKNRVCVVCWSGAPNSIRVKDIITR
jgi:hypothetical protein